MRCKKAYTWNWRVAGPDTKISSSMDAERRREGERIHLR
jgi:hypothetical protein